MHQSLIDFYNQYFRKLSQAHSDYLWRIITKLDEGKKVSDLEMEMAKEIMREYEEG